jgi:hypothetical protein
MPFRSLELTVSQNVVYAEWQDPHGPDGSANALNYSFAPMDEVAVQHQLQPGGFGVFNAPRDMNPPGTIQIDHDYEALPTHPQGRFAHWRHRIFLRPDRIRISIQQIGGVAENVVREAFVVAATPQQQPRHAEILPNITTQAANTQAANIINH